MATAWFVHRPAVIRNGRRLDGKVFCDEMNRQYHSGGRVIHKLFGAGIVVAVNGSLLSIDFGKNGIRRMDRSWVEKNCAAE